MLLAVMGAAAVPGPGPGHANSARTDQFLWKCTMREGRNQQEALQAYAQCLGYINGVLDMHAMMVAFAKSKAMFCLPPEGVTIDQAHKIFVKWASDNPKELHQLARSSVMLALKQAFPCKR